MTPRMITTTRLDITHIREHLKRTLKHGARAEHLATHNLDMIEYIFPATSHTDRTTQDRAFWVQHELDHATQDIGGTLGQAAAILLGLRPGTDTTLEQRRQHAATLAGIEPETFRKHWQDHILTDLAYRIYEHLTPHEVTHAPAERSSGYVAAPMQLPMIKPPTMA